MIAIVNIPFRVKIEPNVFVGEDAVDTFEITHELISGTELFNVDIKHIGDDNENTPNISLTMNYDDLKALYSSPQEVLTSIYNHYMRSIDDYVENKEKNTHGAFPHTVYMSPNNGPVLAVIYSDCEDPDAAEELLISDLKKTGHDYINIVRSTMTAAEHDIREDHDPYVKIFEEFVNSCKKLPEEKKSETKEFVNKLTDSLSNAENVEITEF